MEPWLRLAALLALVLVTQGRRAAAAADGPPLDNVATPAALAAAFPSADASWSATDAGYGGPAGGTWSHAVARPIAAEHYTVHATLALAAPADRRDGMEMGAYAVYHAHAQLGGYEAGLAVRHRDDGRYYRVAVSSLWRELVLWRPSGGVVQVADFPFEAGKTYALSVTCRGPRLIVRVDGRTVIDWWDTADPVPGGTVALARKEGASYFTSMRITPDPPPAAGEQPPAHAPQFRERQWHGGRWYFDGAEPLFVLRDDNVLDHMKLTPGYRPAMYAFNFITDWARFYPKKITGYRLVGSGERLVIETTAVDPDKPGPITCTSRLAVSYNAARRVYEYDHSCSVHLPDAAEAAQVSGEWDHGDAVFLGSVGSAQTRDPAAARPRYEWSVFEAPGGGLYKVPHNHNGHYVGRSSANGGPLRQDGGRVVAVGDPVLSPVIAIPHAGDGFESCRADLCWWGMTCTCCSGRRRSTARSRRARTPRPSATPPCRH